MSTLDAYEYYYYSLSILKIYILYYAQHICYIYIIGRVQCQVCSKAENK